MVTFGVRVCSHAIVFPYANNTVSRTSAAFLLLGSTIVTRPVLTSYQPFACLPPSTFAPLFEPPLLSPSLALSCRLAFSRARILCRRSFSLTSDARLMKNCSVEIFEELSVRAIIYALTFNIPNEWYGSCSLLCHQRPLNVLQGNAATMFPILWRPHYQADDQNGHQSNQKKALLLAKSLLLT